MDTYLKDQIFIPMSMLIANEDRTLVISNQMLWLEKLPHGRKNMLFGVELRRLLI